MPCRSTRSNISCQRAGQSGIDNVIVELNSPNAIMDGSAAPFVYLIQEAGVKTLDGAAPLSEITRRSRWPVATAHRDPILRSLQGDLTASRSIIRCCGHQSPCTIRLTAEFFVDEIAPARTFTFLKEVEMPASRVWRSAGPSRTRLSSPTLAF